jgi:hypothetical protein
MDAAGTTFWAFAILHRPESRRCADGHTSITDWNCGDHGSDFEWKAILDGLKRWTAD